MKGIVDGNFPVEIYIHLLRPISSQEKFPRTENFPKISLLKIIVKISLFSDVKFMSANHISQNFLSAENFPEWKWAFRPNQEQLQKMQLPGRN